MSRNADIVNALGREQRLKVKAPADALIAEELTLRQLRRGRKLTQHNIAKSLHIYQGGVSKIEKRSDLLISTLRAYVEAVGGTLSLVVEFRSRAVLLSGITATDTQSVNSREPQK